mmetsp:Transcript_29233/g.57384  ORF Transcript_29233/g.57384 Transcript_29233/m.57384 type:complete len:262 (-) Transcript_29233:2197-2982(-)
MQAKHEYARMHSQSRRKRREMLEDFQPLSHPHKPSFTKQGTKARKKGREGCSVHLQDVLSELLQLLKLGGCGLFGKSPLCHERALDGHADVLCRPSGTTEVEGAPSLEEVVIQHRSVFLHPVLDVDLLLLVSREGGTEPRQHPLLLVCLQFISVEELLGLVPRSEVKHHGANGDSLALQDSLGLDESPEGCHACAQSRHDDRVFGVLGEVHEGVRQRAHQLCAWLCPREVVGAEPHPVLLVSRLPGLLNNQQMDARRVHRG